MANYYDRSGQPMAMEEWATAFEDMGNVVKKTTVGEAEVSTVWLGIDHRFLGDGPPLIFETMIFDGPFNNEQYRYSTEAEALAHHDQLAEALRSGASQLPEPSPAAQKGESAK